MQAQAYGFYFQSWVSIAGLLFALIMSLTTFLVYKKSHIASLKFVSMSFLLSAFAYLIIGYHASYCKVCSDLTMCSASHNYPNFLTMIALIIFVVMALLFNAKKNMLTLKFFSKGIFIASFFMFSLLFVSVQFIEMPDVISYVLTELNMQGFVFFSPLILIVLSFVYVKVLYKVSKFYLLLFSLLFMSFLPQAYHILICTECHAMECSEFYLVSAFFMITSIALLLYAIFRQLKERST